jgi:hypothetical protein
MINYNVELIIDSKRLGARYIQDIYAMFGLESPSEEELIRCRETGTIGFSTSQRGNLLKLTEMVMNIPSAGIKIQSSE